MNKIYSIILLLSLSIFTYGQDISYHQYSSLDGLSSSHVNDLLQDAQHFIWIATNTGLNRFDGYHFTHYDINNGLLDNDVKKIYEDKKQRIWILGRSGKICFFKDGVFYPYAYNKTILQLTNYTEEIDEKSFSVNNDSVYFNIYNVGRILIDPNGYVHSILYKNGVSNNFINSKNKTLSYFLSSNSHKFSLYTKKDTTSYFYSFSNTQSKYIVERIDSTIFLASQNKLYIINPSSIDSTLFKKKIISCSVSSNHQLWIGFEEGGVKQYSNKRKRENYSSWRLRTKSVSAVIKDIEGSIWIATLNSGVFYMPSDYFKIIQTKDGLPSTDIRKLELSKNYLWAITGNNTVSKLSYRGIINRNYNDKDFCKISDILWSKDKLWISFCNNISYIDTANKLTTVLQNTKDKPFFIKGIIQNNKKDIWIYKNNGFAYLDPKRKEIGLESHNFTNFIINKILPIDNNNIWIACNDGLRRYKNKKLINYNIATPILANRINDLIVDEKNKDLWLSINGVGVIRVHGDTVTSIGTKEGLISNSTTSLFAFKDDVWVGTKKGISRIHLLSNVKYEIRNFKVSSGLLFSEINDIVVNDRFVFAATSNGINFFSYKKIKKNLLAPPIFIVSKNQERIIYHQKKEARFSYQNNGIRIEYLALNYKSMGKIQYRFRIKELNEEWNYTTNTSTDYPYLPPGKYHFEVYASNEDGIWSLKPAEIIIYVSTPFWKTWWFISLIILLIIAIYALIHYSVYKKRKQKERIRTEINEFRQMALNQQVNPHFIFNALNSIQHYILQNDIKLSNKFLTKFSRLIRIILENSRKKTIRLEDEIYALTLYLELESLRFKDRMKYSFSIDPDINQLDIMIPPMLIQPFIENAIWHGLMNKDDEEQGFLEIKFTQEDNHILCFIKDNGIGRKKAEELKQMRKPNHKSLGAKITQSRIELINNLYNEKIKIEYEDLYDNQGNARGTIVRIHFPLIYKL